MEVVNMPIPLHFSDNTRRSQVRLVMAGYLQSWLRLGTGIRALEEVLDEGQVELELILPRHWGNLEGEDTDSETQRALASIKSHSTVQTYRSLGFEEFQEHLSQADVFVDFAEHTLEREYAMVTRTVTALACGVPAVHPVFTEVSDLIADYDAGWLIDVEDSQSLPQTLRQITEDRNVVDRKKENARRLAQEVIDPKIAVRPLVDLVRT